MLKETSALPVTFLIVAYQEVGSVSEDDCDLDKKHSDDVGMASEFSVGRLSV